MSFFDRDLGETEDSLLDLSHIFRYVEEENEFYGHTGMFKKIRFVFL